MHVQAILDNFTEKLRSFTGRFAKANIEKAIFKGLVSSWITVMLILCLMLIVSQFRGDIESRLIDTANRSTYKTTSEEKLKIYKAVFPLIKYAEPMSKYIQDIDRDPFLRYEEGLFMQPLNSSTHEFIVKSVNRTLLPFVYKGFIELPEYIVGQINWEADTIFVKAGSRMHDFAIEDVSKRLIKARDKYGIPIEFELNKPIFGNELQAELLDVVTQKSYTVQRQAEIDSYKVIDITDDYVILLQEGMEIRLDYNRK